MAMIRFQNCEIWEGNYKVFSGLNLQINAGEHIHIQGPNGGGKTFLGKTIAGKTTIKNGIVELSSEIQSLKDEVSFVPTRTFDVLFSSSNFLFYQQRYYTTSNEEAQTVRAFLGDQLSKLKKWTNFKELNVSGFLDVKVTGLSNGQLRKLVLLKTIANEPKVLVLDYPYEGLDHESRNEFNQLLENVVEGLQCTLVIIDNQNTLPNITFKRLWVKDFQIHENMPAIQHIHLPELEEPIEATEEVIKLNKVQVKYQDKAIFSDFNWEVKKGERWLLRGANGSGKSTILSLIFADHPQAYKNDISLFGKQRGKGESIWEIKNRISFLSAEQFTFSPNSYKNHHTVEEVLVSTHKGPFNKDLTKNQTSRLMDEYLTYFGILNVKKQRFRELSSGLKQVVLLIRTFIHKKELILLDEPFEYLDIENQNIAKAFINKCLDPDDTLIIISHHHESEFPSVKNVKFLVKMN